MAEPATAASIEDQLADRVRDSLAAVEQMRTTVMHCRARVDGLEREHIVLKTENLSLREQLGTERNERTYYQRFAREIASSMGKLGDTCDEIVRRAQDAASRKRPPSDEAPPQAEEPPPPRPAPTAAQPEVNIPKFLRQPPRQD